MPIFSVLAGFSTPSCLLASPLNGGPAASHNYHQHDGLIAVLLLSAGIKGATALSQATIAGGAIAGVSLSLRRRSPIDPSQPILNLPLALIFTPVLLLGVSIGGLAHFVIIFILKTLS